MQSSLLPMASQVCRQKSAASSTGFDGLQLPVTLILASSMVCAVCALSRQLLSSVAMQAQDVWTIVAH